MYTTLREAASRGGDETTANVLQVCLCDVCMAFVFYDDSLLLTVLSVWQSNGRASGNPQAHRCSEVHVLPLLKELRCGPFLFKSHIQRMRAERFRSRRSCALASGRTLLRCYFSLTSVMGCSSTWT